MLSAVLMALYARGAWPLGFVALVPWLSALQLSRTMRGASAAAVGMSMAHAIAAFGWFAPAIADYTGWPRPAALLLLLLLGPVLQPQFLAFALARHLLRARPAVASLVAIAAWLATEWAVPRLFGDTLGHGLYPALRLRQLADIAGVGGLTLLLLVVNDASAAALMPLPARRRILAAATALLLPALAAGYGAVRLAALERVAPSTHLRAALVQASIVDYEAMARVLGPYAVVRRVLDTHYALSTQALARAPIDALVWPETVYPTTFGQPKSAAGGELDRELGGFVARSGVPLVFGTYDRDGHGEYNAAAFVDPLRGPLGAYRKTRLFPLTEYVPPMLDGPTLRRALPWAGTWQPGDGARVFPLRAADGRDVPVVPLICRDDLDPQLAIDGARLGAQAIIGLSNDAWFTRDPLGARLHLAVAAFRSVETRLPQVRATTNGISAVIDERGTVVARTRMGERTVLVGDLAIRERSPTLAVMAGQWLGPVSAASVVLALVAALSLRRRRASATGIPAASDETTAADGPYVVRLLRPWQRALLAILRLIARTSVLVLGLAVLFGDDTMQIGLAEMRRFAVFVLLPEGVAIVLDMAFRARLRFDSAQVVIETHRRSITIPLERIASLRPWRLTWPTAGFDVVLASGHRWSHGLATADADALAARIHAAAPLTDATRRSTAWRQALAQPARRLDHPAIKFLLFPLLPALPAFRLHQHIAYGDTFGEYYSFGLGAYVSALLLWWASWSIGLVLIAAALRILVEAGTAAAVAVHPQRAARVRDALLKGARLVYFVGVPAWLVLRLLAA